MYGYLLKATTTKSMLREMNSLIIINVAVSTQSQGPFHCFRNREVTACRYEKEVSLDCLCFDAAQSQGCSGALEIEGVPEL